MGKQKIDCVVNANNPTAARIANAVDKLTMCVTMPVKFARNFLVKQSSFSLRSRSSKDISGPKALGSRSQLHEKIDPTIKSLGKQGG